jgi:hypothetical protein
VILPEGYCQLGFVEAVHGAAATDENRGSIAIALQLSCLQNTLAGVIAADDENDVRRLRLARVNQKSAKRGQDRGRKNRGQKDKDAD